MQGLTDTFVLPAHRGNWVHPPQLHPGVPGQRSAEGEGECLERWPQTALAGRMVEVGTRVRPCWRSCERRPFKRARHWCFRTAVLPRLPAQTSGCVLGAVTAWDVRTARSPGVGVSPVISGRRLSLGTPGNLTLLGQAVVLVWSHPVGEHVARLGGHRPL